MTLDWSIFPGVLLCAVATIISWFWLQRERRTGHAPLQAWSREQNTTAFKIRQGGNWIVFAGLSCITLATLLQFVGIISAFHF